GHLPPPGPRPGDILLRGHGLKVVRVVAPRVEAQVVDVEPLRDRPHDRLVGGAVGIHLLALPRGPPVALVVNRAVVLPALLEHAHLGRLTLFRYWGTAPTLEGREIP